MYSKSKLLVATVTPAMLYAFALDVARSCKTAVSTLGGCEEDHQMALQPNFLGEWVATEMISFNIHPFIYYVTSLE